MKVKILNVQHVKETNEGYEVEFSAGQIEFHTKDKVFALGRQFTFKLNHELHYTNLRDTSSINTFNPNGIEIIASGMFWSASSMLQANDFALDKYIIQLIRTTFK